MRQAKPGAQSIKKRRIGPVKISISSENGKMMIQVSNRKAMKKAKTLLKKIRKYDFIISRASIVLKFSFYLDQKTNYKISCLVGLIFHISSHETCRCPPINMNIRIITSSNFLIIFNVIDFIRVKRKYAYNKFYLIMKLYLNST